MQQSRSHDWVRHRRSIHCFRGELERATALFDLALDAWEEEGAKILRRYGIEFKDRSTSMWDAAGEAVEKMQGAS